MATAYHEPVETGPGRELYMPAVFRRISWGAIFAGTVVALVVALTLNLLGLGIGMATVNPATEENPLGGVGIGAGIWLALSSLIALFAGGWVAGRMSGFPMRLTTVLHGLTVWALMTLITLYMATSTVGTLLGGVTSVIGRGVSMIGGAASAVPQVSGGDGALKPFIDRVLAEATPTEKAIPPQQLSQAASQLFAGGSVNEQNRQNAIATLTTNTAMTRPEAEKTVEGWAQQYQQLRAQLPAIVGQTQEQALQTTERAMDALATAAIWAFVALVIGAVAAGAGGAVGAPKETVTGAPLGR
jgi:hypothetical protein